MKKLPFTLLALSILPLTTYAIENGRTIDWQHHDNSVRFDSQQTGRIALCTGTLIAGRYVLTAAHCLVEDELDSFTTASTQHYLANNKVIHENFIIDSHDGFDSEDVGLVVLDDNVDYHDVQFLNISEHVQNEPFTIAGFGGTKETEAETDFVFDHYHYKDHFALYAEPKDIDSHTVGGDSGAAWVNQNNEIMAIHKGSDTDFTYHTHPTYGTDIKGVQAFITEHINGWHYPTLASATGRTTITVQSLHQNNVVDSAYVDGDVTLLTDESSCISKGSISPFEECTYVIESNGDEGELYLSDNEVIHINKASPEPTPTPTPTPTPDDGGSSGGSIGAWGLLSLGLLELYRRMKK